MKTWIEKQYLDNILTALDRQIGAHGGIPIHIIVCGGSALIFLDLTARATTDVDILGQMDESGNTIRSLQQLPDWFRKAADKVERDFNLPENWINTGPASQVDSGLPPAITERLLTKTYGPFLTVSFISRIDQIYLKLYASVDRGGYHVDDLLNLNPSTQEMIRACRWVLAQDVSPGFRQLLLSFLKQKGFGHVAEEI